MRCTFAWVKCKTLGLIHTAAFSGNQPYSRILQVQNIFPLQVAPVAIASYKFPRLTQYVGMCQHCQPLQMVSFWLPLNQPSCTGPFGLGGRVSPRTYLWFRLFFVGKTREDKTLGTSNSLLLGCSQGLVDFLFGATCNTTDTLMKPQKENSAPPTLKLWRE